MQNISQQPPKIEEAVFEVENLATVYAKLNGRSESDFIAFQTFFGTQLGRTRYVVCAGEKVFPNLFQLNIGSDSRALRDALCVFEGLRPLISIIRNGGAHVESLAYQMRDRLYRPEKIYNGEGQRPTFDVVQIDRGIPARNFLLVADDFLDSCCGRAAASAKLRAAGKNLFLSRDLAPYMTYAVGGFLRSTDRHVGAILQSDTGKARGLSSDFRDLFLLSLSRDADLLAPAEDSMAESFCLAIAETLQSQRQGEVTFDDAAANLFHAVVGDLQSLSDDKLITVKLAKLSLNFSSIQLSDQIGLRHVTPAAAVLRYSLRVQQYLAGSTELVGVNALKILSALEKNWLDGLSRTEIYNLFRRNVQRIGVQDALDFLSQRNLARCVKEQPTNGRPPERWYATNERGET